MLLLKNATIYPQTAESPYIGDLLCKDGKIRRVSGVEADARVLDLTGLHLLPGLIDCHSHIGLQDPGSLTGLGSITETTHPITPHMSTLYGADAASPYFGYAVENGVTTVGIIPGSANVVGGSGFACRTWGENIFEMSLRDNICLKAALGENPKGFYQNKGCEPDSRMGATFLLAELLYNARDYHARKEAGAAVAPDEKLEAVLPVLRRQVPLRVHCTHNDMMSVIEILKEFDVLFTLEHAWGSLNYLDQIVESGCAIVYGPIGGRRSFFESRRTDIASVAILDRRGVNVALTTDSPILGLDGLLHMLEQAVREGTDPGRAMRMVTINAARIMGVEHRVGSVEPGKDANFAIFRGVPGVDMGAHVVYTVCEGKVAYTAPGQTGGKYE